MNNKIFVPVNEVRRSLKEKGSEFIGIVTPLESIEGAEQQLIALKKEFFDASHHCFACRDVLGKSKYSDDGEPKGSAGIRILNAIEHANLTNLLVTVVRYFGGTKLGIGPLGNMYYSAALDALEQVSKRERSYYDICLIELPAADSSVFYHLLSQYGAKIDNTRFEQNYQHTVTVPFAQSLEFRQQLSERSAGRIQSVIKQQKVLI